MVVILTEKAEKARKYAPPLKKTINLIYMVQETGRIYGNGGQNGRGEAVAVSYGTSTGSRSVYLGKDIMGSVRTATGESGRLEDRYEYDVFGTPYMGDLSGGMNLGYMSKPFDSATMLYNYGFRDYKPQVARFTTLDPIRDGNNWFVYVNNDPVNFIDLWGLCAERVTIPASVFIVEGTGWPEDRVREYMENITTIFNKNGVMLNLDITYEPPIPRTDDLSFFYPDARYQRDKLGNGHFFDETGERFIYIFTENTGIPGVGVHIPGTTTVVMHNNANNSTPAHETGHIMGLDDTGARGGPNLMDHGRPHDINQINLNDQQRHDANKYLVFCPIQMTIFNVKLISYVIRN